MTNYISSEIIFEKSTKMADILHINYNLLAVLDRFDIHLGFGDKTIEEVCDERHVNADYFVILLNIYHNPKWLRNNPLPDMDLLFLVNYLKKTHRYYTKAILPTINQLIGEIKSQTKDDFGLSLLDKLYKEYVIDFTEHLDYEEEIVFPYASILSIANEDETCKCEMDDIDFRIGDFIDIHALIEQRLYSLKNILIKYSSAHNDESVVHLLYLIYRFEEDLRNHAILEDELLVPLIEKLEKKIFSE